VSMARSSLVATALLLGAVAASAACLNATSLVERNEIFSQYPYIDNVNRKSICYGFKLYWPGAEAKVEAVGGNYSLLVSDDWAPTRFLTRQQCSALLDLQVHDAMVDATALFGPKCPCAMAALVDLIYSVGDQGVLAMGNFVDLVKTNRWTDAGNELIMHSWCRMNNMRCNHDRDLISYGCRDATATSLRASSDVALPAHLPALYQPPAPSMPTAMASHAVAGALDDCRRLSNGGAQFLCSMAVTVFVSLFDHQKLLDCMADAVVAVDDFWNMGSSVHQAFNDWSGGSKITAAKDMDHALGSAKDGLTKFNAVLNECPGLTALAAKIGELVSRLASWIGNLLTILDTIFHVGDIVSLAESIVSNWGNWVVVGADAANALCDIMQLLGHGC